MISPRLRPRFEMRVPYPASETLDRLNEKLAAQDCMCKGEVAGNHFHLNITKNLQHIWSPHLNLEVIDDGSESIIHGHFGPRSDIWTMFMAIYAICGFIFFMGLFFLLSQWMLGMQPWALWPVIGAVIIAVAVYFFALSGQALSQEQMQMLLGFVEDAEGIEAKTS